MKADRDELTLSWFFPETSNTPIKWSQLTDQQVRGNGRLLVRHLSVRKAAQESDSVSYLLAHSV